MNSTKPVSKPERSPLSFARILWMHRVLVFLIAIAGSAGSLVIVQRLPALYRSEALILVESQRIPDRYVSSTVNAGVQDRLATISQEILSTARLQKLIDNLGLYREERKKLVQEEIIDLMRKDISITIEKGFTRDRLGAFRVGYQGRNPTLVAEVASQLANLFIEENLRTRERQAEGTEDFIDSQLREAKQTLDQLEAKVSKYKLAHSGDLPEQQNTLAATLSRLQIELQGNQDATNRAQQNLVLLQGTLELTQASAGVASNLQQASRSRASGVDGVPNPAFQKESELLQAQYDALSQHYKAAYPQMVALKREIEKQKVAEDAEKARIDNVKTQIGLAKAEIQQRNRERQQILGSIKEYQARIEQLPAREQEVAELTRDYDISKANYKSLLDKKLAAGMASDMERRQQGERFTLLDPPRVPEKPVSPRTPLLDGIGVLLSMALAVAFAVLLESKKNRLLGEWELEEGVDVLGRVPRIRSISRIQETDEQTPPTKRRRRLAPSAVFSFLGTCVPGPYSFGRRR